MPAEEQAVADQEAEGQAHVPCPYCHDTGRVPASAFIPAQRCTCPAGGWTPRPEPEPGEDC